eukprot:1477-Heterococcus_DN1.PRE.2
MLLLVTVKHASPNNATAQYNIVRADHRLCLARAVRLYATILLHLLPANRAEQEHLIVEKTRSKLGGIVFLTVLVCSLLWATTEAFAVVFAAEHKHQQSV